MISAKAAEITGLKAGTPVVGGGGDQAAQAVGVGAVTPGIVALTLGTSGVVFATTPSPLIEPKDAFTRSVIPFRVPGILWASCYPLPAHYAGTEIRWLRAWDTTSFWLRPHPYSGRQ